jgi:hypothetical protein
MIRYLSQSFVGQFCDANMQILYIFDIAADVKWL